MADPYIFTVLSIFPDLIKDVVKYSILGRAITNHIIKVNAIDIRDFTTDRHRTTDDQPYGGGPGMVMKVEPIARAIRKAKQDSPSSPVILLSASGRLFTQSLAKSFVDKKGLILVCGHYEGVDERIAEFYVDEEISIGDYVLSGGELPALVVIDAVARLLPGVVGNTASLSEESHQYGLLEYPQYTRPAEFEGFRVPEVLLSGNHAEIAKFRRTKALEKTRKMRPDLIRKLGIKEDENNL